MDSQRDPTIYTGFSIDAEAGVTGNLTTTRKVRPRPLVWQLSAFDLDQAKIRNICVS